MVLQALIDEKGFYIIIMSLVYTNVNNYMCLFFRIIIRIRSHNTKKLISSIVNISA